MSASERLAEMQNRAVLRGLKMPTPGYMIVASDLIGALPELIAVVKAAERQVAGKAYVVHTLQQGNEAAENERGMATVAALTALERKLEVAE